MLEGARKESHHAMRRNKELEAEMVRKKFTRIHPGIGAKGIDSNKIRYLVKIGQ